MPFAAKIQLDKLDKKSQAPGSVAEAGSNAESPRLSRHALRVLIEWKYIRTANTYTHHYSSINCQIRDRLEIKMNGKPPCKSRIASNFSGFKEETPDPSMGVTIAGPIVGTP